MKRSKPVAEKIGIPFDWNCAISLRELDANDIHDPHRHISKYADWDVLGNIYNYYNIIHICMNMGFMDNTKHINIS